MSNEQAAQARSVTGELTYRERMALRPGSTATVSVVDYAVADRISAPLAETSLEVGGRTPPIPFALEITAGSLGETARPGLRAIIRDGQGALVFSTDTVMPITFEDGVAALGQVPLVRAADLPDRDGDSQAVTYLCGAAQVRVRYGDGSATLLVGPAASPAAYELDRAEAGSGTLYQRVDDKGRTAFRTKGDEARLSVYGRAYPLCARGGQRGARQAEGVGQDTPPALTGEPWMIEDVVGMGVVDASAPRIRFGEDGTLSGRTGCNNFSGSYEVAGSKMTIGPVATTRKMCPEALMRQEQRIVGVLNDATAAAKSGENAVVVRASDDRSITLRR